MSEENKKLLNDLVEYLTLKGVEVTELDKDYFASIINFASNNGSRATIRNMGKKWDKKSE